MERVVVMDTQDHNLSQFLNGHSAHDPKVKLALDDVRKSGLSPETLQKAGATLFSDGPDILSRRLNLSLPKGNQILSNAMLMEIPYGDSQGNPIKYEYRLYPEVDDRKYLQPLGSTPIPYIPREVWTIKDKINRPLFITEGVKKVLKINQHGESCIGLSGVWSFRAGKDEETGSLLCKDLDSFAWRGRTVYLAFDTDLWTNPQVRKALYELALHLIARGALVYICAWKGAKGIDDYLATKTDPAKELSEIKDKAKLVTSFITLEHRDDIIFALSRTIGTMDDLTRESVIAAISKRLNLRPRSLYRKFSKEIVEKVLDVTDEQKEEAIRLLKSPTLIKLFLDICHTRYIGRDKVLILVKLATLTRHLPRGLSVVLLGTSSVGKSELVDTVLMTCDPTRVENFSRTSAQYLLYRKEPLEHKVITFYEFNGADSSSAIIRTALTEGELHLGTVQKDASGSLCATEIKKETQGLVILSTYTGSRIDGELATRVLLQEITHDETLAREVYRRKAEHTEDKSDAFRVWKVADALIEARPVVIPYLRRLADLFPTREERFHRDYDKTVMLIKASVLLHQYQREETEHGAVVANEDDYRLVYSLGDAFAQSLLSVSEPVVKMLEIARTMGKPTRSELRERLDVSEATMKRYISQAKRAELIETEGRGEKQIVTVLDIPRSFTVLPAPEDIFVETNEPMSQTVQPIENTADRVDQPSLSRDELNEPAHEENGSNGSGGSNDSEPEESLSKRGSAPNSSTAHENDDVFVPEDDCEDFSDVRIEGV